MLQTNEETIYKESFRKPLPTVTKCKPIVIPEVKLIEPTSRISIDWSSLTPYQVNRNAHVPFDLFWVPKPIIGQVPNYNIFKYDPPKNPKIKVKMSTVLPPCTPPEETSDEKTYETIVNNMYLSTKSKADKDVDKFCNPQVHADSCFYNTSNPIKFNTEIYEKLPEKYIEMGKEWDNKNPRWLSDRNKFFWDKYFHDQQKRKLSQENEQTLQSNQIQEMNDLLKADQLRLPHTTYKFGYGGYKPVIAYGVPLKKNNSPVDHPLTTTTAASYRHKQL